MNPTPTFTRPPVGADVGFETTAIRPQDLAAGDQHILQFVEVGEGPVRDRLIEWFLMRFIVIGGLVQGLGRFWEADSLDYRDVSDPTAKGGSYIGIATTRDADHRRGVVPVQDAIAVRRRRSTVPVSR